MAAQGDQPYTLVLFKRHFENISQSINTRDSEESTPLHWACFCNSHRIINFLVSLGADVDSRDINGATPMHVALKSFDWRDQRKAFITIRRLYNSGADPGLKDKAGISTLNLAREFPDKDISEKLVKILTRRKIPLIESGNATGRHRLVSVAYAVFMTLVIGGYSALTYPSGAYSRVETGVISFFSAVSLLTFMYAIYIRPQYAPIPKHISDQQRSDNFLELLKETQFTMNKRICAYCQIEKPDKARHCFICKRCVLDHDRHCMMLNNCVGKDNRVFVIAYLTSTSFLLSAIVASAVLLFTGVLCGDQPGDHPQKQFKDDCSEYGYGPGGLSPLSAAVATLSAGTSAYLIVVLRYLYKFCRNQHRSTKASQPWGIPTVQKASLCRRAADKVKAVFGFRNNRGMEEHFEQGLASSGRSGSKTRKITAARNQKREPSPALDEKMIKKIQKQNKKKKFHIGPANIDVLDDVNEEGEDLIFQNEDGAWRGENDVNQANWRSSSSAQTGGRHGEAGGFRGPGGSKHDTEYDNGRANSIGSHVSRGSVHDLHAQHGAPVSMLRSASQMNDHRANLPQYRQGHLAMARQLHGQRSQDRRNYPRQDTSVTKMSVFSDQLLLSADGIGQNNTYAPNDYGSECSPQYQANSSTSQTSSHNRRYFGERSGYQDQGRSNHDLQQSISSYGAERFREERSRGGGRATSNITEDFFERDANYDQHFGNRFFNDNQSRSPMASDGVSEAMKQSMGSNKNYSYGRSGSSQDSERQSSITKDKYTGFWIKNDDNDEILQASFSAANEPRVSKPMNMQ